jgi:hypothetical protein
MTASTEKKKKKAVICNNIDGTGDHLLREINWAQKDKHCRISLLWNLRKLIQ